MSQSHSPCVSGKYPTWELNVAEGYIPAATGVAMRVRVPLPCSGQHEPAFFLNLLAPLTVQLSVETRGVQEVRSRRGPETSERWSKKRIPDQLRPVLSSAHVNEEKPFEISCTAQHTTEWKVTILWRQNKSIQPTGSSYINNEQPFKANIGQKHDLTIQRNALNVGWFLK